MRRGWIFAWLTVLVAAACLTGVDFGIPRKALPKVRIDGVRLGMSLTDVEILHGFGVPSYDERLRFYVFNMPQEKDRRYLPRDHRFLGCPVVYFSKENRAEHVEGKVLSVDDVEVEVGDPWIRISDELGPPTSRHRWGPDDKYGLERIDVFYYEPLQLEVAVLGGNVTDFNLGLDPLKQTDKERTP